MAENGNKRWTPEEDSRLRELIRSPAAAFDIAAELGRTVSAVKGRAQLLRLTVSRDDYLHRPAIQRLLSFFGASTGFWVCRMPLGQEPGLFTFASATSTVKSFRTKRFHSASHHRRRATGKGCRSLGMTSGDEIECAKSRDSRIKEAICSSANPIMDHWGSFVKRGAFLRRRIVRATPGNPRRFRLDGS
jgi:hypothetical protein